MTDTQFFNNVKESKMETSINTITVNNVDYVRADQVVAQPIGNRAVVVVDRGWVFAGDVVRENGRIKLSRAVHVYRWESIGFDGMIANPKSNKVTLKPLSTGVDIPQGAEVFCVPVDVSWGL